MQQIVSFDFSHFKGIDRVQKLVSCKAMTSSAHLHACYLVFLKEKQFYTSNGSKDLWSQPTLNADLTKGIDSLDSG